MTDTPGPLGRAQVGLGDHVCTACGAPMARRRRSITPVPGAPLVGAWKHTRRTTCTSSNAAPVIGTTVSGTPVAATIPADDYRRRLDAMIEREVDQDGGVYDEADEADLEELHDRILRRRPGTDADPFSGQRWAWA